MWNQIILKKNCKIISVFYFTCDHVGNQNKTISAAEGVLELFQNYFSYDGLQCWNNFEIISGKLPRVEIKLFQSDLDEGWNNFEIILFLHSKRSKCNSDLECVHGYGDISYSKCYGSGQWCV